jgi:hypothetical protein
METEEHVLTRSVMSNTHDRSSWVLLRASKNIFFTLLMDVLRLTEEGVLADHAFIQSGCVLSDTERGKGPCRFAR